MRILVVEDNRDILANLADYLGLKGYTVDCAQDGLTGLHLAATEHYDLIVLDVMLPGIDGFTLCKRLREDARRDTPIVMLTARDQLEDRLQGFRQGADDYLIKPFALSELSARIDAITSRAQGGFRRTLQVADLKYDLDTLEVTRAGQLLKLNPVGLKLLAILMKKSPHVLRREVLEEALWGEDSPDSDSLRSHVHQLRQAIDKPYARALLHTVRGVGYRLTAGRDMD
ncbi:response regulator transcription factor [Pseudomonas sp. RIT-PI-S]|uniref:response regulator transcription factor n=1 Tax=Pseudomonas sp. RIT-PI-S TaxID=3035295 RepID=UPI0021DA4D92|nr:response regulator transcription factor [Pseudomonas sp. RIT-PI-S]